MAYLDYLLFRNVWLVLGLWILVYTGDFLLTLLGASLYRRTAREYIIYEGSYELTPTFQKDVDALRWINPRFLGFALLSIVLIYLIWWLEAQILGTTLFFPLVMGALFLRAAAIYIRHLRNISLFRNIGQGSGVKGRIEYRRWLVLRNSAVELVSYALLYLVFYYLVRSWFFLGGTIACLVTGGQHFWWSRKSS